MKKGFTLIEMVVVLSVVAILAAILTPTIVKNIKDAKITRARNEVQVIGGALASFYKDLGSWPFIPSSLEVLYGPSGSTASTGSWQATATSTDNFVNHLISNTAAYTACTFDGQERCWDGPYLGEIKADPWGNYYEVNIGNTGGSIWVMSAGVNKTMDTPYNIATTAVSASFDDLGVRLK